MVDEERIFWDKPFDSLDKPQLALLRFYLKLKKKQTKYVLEEVDKQSC